MESELTCAVCSDVYLEGKREPVTLPECGHTFCRQCLLNLERAGTGSLSCPYCRAKHQGQPVSQMATVYALLSLTKFFRRSKFGMCEAHGSNLDFWCETCALGLCGFCLHENHNKCDHDVAIMKDAMESKKSEIRKAGIHFLDDINKEKRSLMKEIHDCLIKVGGLCDRAESLTSSVKDIKEVMVDAGESFSMDLVINLLEKMKGFRPMAMEEPIGDASGSTMELPNLEESPAAAALLSENRSSRSRCDSAEDDPQPSDTRTNISFLSSLDDSCVSSSSGTDTEEERFSPSENGAAACASRTVLLTECPTFMTRHRLFSRYRTERDFRRCDPPGAAPSVTLTMLRRDYSGIVFPAVSSTSDDNPNDLSTGQAMMDTTVAVVNSHGNQYSDTLQARQNDIVALGEGADITTPASWLPWSARGNDSREGRFRWEDGRLHLYTLTENMQEVHGTIKLPVIVSLLPNHPEVFLDLGVDGVPFGRVYIKLWGELRRAQHFLALCVGYLGPSYRGSRCSKVEGKDKPGECLRVNHYVTENGIVTARGLMDGLEWSGEYSTVKREGLIVAASGGRSEYDGCFDICTRGNPAKKFSCPFGEVVSGMAVVKEATHHDPIGDLVIMNTGVVVIDHMT